MAELPLSTQSNIFSYCITGFVSVNGVSIVLDDYGTERWAALTTENPLEGSTQFSFIWKTWLKASIGVAHVRPPTTLFLHRDSAFLIAACAFPIA